jgi:hypothetical protein
MILPAPQRYPNHCEHFRGLAAMAAGSVQRGLDPGGERFAVVTPTTRQSMNLP